MGIRGLYSKLQPHGEPITFGGDDALEEGLEYSHFVIDGPAFVFWVYYQAVVDAHAEAKATPRHTLPSYEAVITASHDWLNRLESIALPIKFILFDGALPDHKVSTRMQRLHDSVSRTRALKSRASSFEIDMRPVSKTGIRLQHVIASHSTGLVPPFIVTAVLESLLDSKFRRRTIVLPGEADAACVSDAFSAKEDIILTGDTDLIVHGPPGSVMFLADLQHLPASQGRSELRGQIFKPKELMEKLGVQDPLCFAFLLDRDIRIGLEEAAAASNEVDLNSGLYNDAYSQFQEQYVLPSLVWSENDPDLDALLKKLDPRTTEVVFQALFAGTKPRTVRTFLHFPLEDTDRVSASLPGRDIRVLALSVLATLTDQQHQYSEVDRKAEKPEAIRLSVLDIDEMASGLESLRAALSSFQTGMFLQPSEWRLFAILHVLRWTAANNRTVPPVADVIRLAKGLQPSISWREIHHGAQVEGVLMSLRFLYQILRVRSAIQGTSAASSALFEAVDSVYQLLMAMPPVSKLMPYSCAALRVDMPEQTLRGHLAQFYEGEEAAVQSSRRDRKKARRLKEPTAAQATVHSTNRFALLESSTK